ncbi:DNA recombination protein RmuC [Acidiplasma sp.]|uniref:DNA recombination protein RmuC n=1 Tax=Acidiplasma sp. TaxID=1872114 RepID=UPI003167B0F1
MLNINLQWFLSGMGAGIISGILIYYVISRKTMNSMLEKLNMNFKDVINKYINDQNSNLINTGSMVFKNAIETERQENEKNLLKISSIIEPLKESLKSYNEYLESAEKSRKMELGSLNNNIENLYKKINSLETDTNKLVYALKNPSIRGKWGEITLRRIVEMAGMSPYCDFSEQTASNDSEAKPDMIIRMPNNRRVIIDSKVPMTGYFEYLENPENKDQLARYVSAFNNHVRELSNKKYWEKFNNSVDFVIMFIPLESLLGIIMENSSSIIEDAISKKVIIATPITLISLLLTIHMGWRDVNTYNNFNSLIADVKEFYKQLDDFTGALNDLSRNINKTVESFNKASKYLNSRLEPVIEKLIKTEIPKEDKNLNIYSVENNADEVNHLN